MVSELDLNNPERPNTAYGWKELGQSLCFAKSSMIHSVAELNRTVLHRTKNKSTLRQIKDYCLRRRLKP